MADVSVERAHASAPAVANPAPLGLSAFALTTFVLSSANAGFLFSKGAASGAIVIGLAVFYGGLTQLIAGVQEFRAGNTFGATAFCSYGAFWLALGFTLMPVFTTSAGPGKNLVDLIGTDAATGVGVFLLGWTIFTALMFLGTFRLNGALVTVFGLLTLTFLALTVGWLGGGPASSATWIQIGGWLGILTALAAWYTALAGVLAGVNSAIRLPTFPMG
jgi:succinate-acetate transporter protein